MFEFWCWGGDVSQTVDDVVCDLLFFVFFQNTHFEFLFLGFELDASVFEFSDFIFLSDLRLAARYV